MELELKQGNSLEVLKNYPDSTFDSVVTDPPYGLSFMGKKWDYDVPSVEIWKEVLRVLKPGGHLVSFSSSRTYHRMTVNVEDAGFEVRDQLMWLYGSGFPKSHNIGKSYDKKMGIETPVEWVPAYPEGTRGATQDITNGWMNDGVEQANGKPGYKKQFKPTNKHEGWGTALKPAHEPIVLARKPLSEKTVVDNVIRWGTGGINIDGSRVAIEGKEPVLGGEVPDVIGRFPANIIHDGSPEVLEGFPQTKGVVGGVGEAGSSGTGVFGWNVGDKKPGKVIKKGTPDSGSAARFFYCAKVSRKERNAGLDHIEDTKMTGRDPGQDELNVAFKLRPTTQKNNHPTVKPVALMTYLCKLITPTNGTILDPFMGSGSTGMAAKQEGFSFTGIDLDEAYVEIAQARIDAWDKK